MKRQAPLRPEHESALRNRSRGACFAAKTAVLTFLHQLRPLATLRQSPVEIKIRDESDELMVASETRNVGDVIEAVFYHAETGGHSLERGAKERCPWSPTRQEIHQLIEESCWKLIVRHVGGGKDGLEGAAVQGEDDFVGGAGDRQHDDSLRAGRADPRHPAESGQARVVEAGVELTSRSAMLNIGKNVFQNRNAPPRN